MKTISENRFPRSACKTDPQNEFSLGKNFIYSFVYSKEILRQQLRLFI